MTIFYRLFDKLYVNVTNRCSCACIFCIRDGGDGVGDANSLWLEREPTLEEIKTAFLATDYTDCTEIVFCGYGEPMERADVVIETAKYIKGKASLPVRLNTNGLAQLIKPDFDMAALIVFDTISISLNAPDEDEYMRVTQPAFGKAAFGAMLQFAKEAARFSVVVFTVLDILTLQQIEHCREIASAHGGKLKIRHYIKNNISYN
ncbi:MAG: TatD family nuclease-associated radical SAM protein [Defluviitaleaceae bacterium]|nr:TatD family nuclease-associated radical SAM protein [Defluviitaleaceae bacterium]